MKRIIITTAGGLGNQMLNYSLWLFYKEKGLDPILYPKIKFLTDHNGYELNRIFSKAERPASHSKIIDFLIKLYNSTIRYEKFIKKKTNIDIHIEKIAFPFNLIELPNHDYVVINQIRRTLLNHFNFPPLYDKRDIAIKQEMENSNSISIHIRRGDYQNHPKWRLALGDICDKEYFENAISKVNSIFSNIHYFIFSDDIEWVKLNLSIKQPVTYIDWHNGNNSYRDMQLMTFCKCNIIANSTFSLMAAFLNKNETYQVIAPQKWRNYYNDNLEKRYLPKNWIRIDNRKPFVTIIIKTTITNKEIGFILRQSFTDFYIILSQKININDTRIKYKIKVNTHFKIICNSKIEVDLFKSRKYLENWLFEAIKDEIQNTY